jgi:UDP-N-acetylglucosamine 2-epimerase (non-hydrolysing)
MAKRGLPPALLVPEVETLLRVDREDGAWWAADGFHPPRPTPGNTPIKICAIFGTRPEMIKLAPVIHQLESARDYFHTVNIASGQHVDLVRPFIELFGIRVDHDLNVMAPGQTPNQVCARVLTALDPILAREEPDLILVQGDTTTALAGALAGFHCQIPVGHIEAGLRSGNPLSPYPEEMNRRLITRLATYHFASTPGNRDGLAKEGVPAERIFVTGNPVVDALLAIRERVVDRPTLRPIFLATEGKKRLVLTLHRRENFGERLTGNLLVLRSFVERHPDVALIFPVHPNPAVRGPANAVLSGHGRIHLLEPLDYLDFIGLLSSAWLIVSDSGGIQEEAPSLGKPLLVLRENTERPEAITSGIARLVGAEPAALKRALDNVDANPDWIKGAAAIANPFGRGDSGRRIVDAILASGVRNLGSGIRVQGSGASGLVHP